MQNGEGTEVSDYESEPESEYQLTLRDGSKKVYDHICTNHGAIMLERMRAIPKHPGAGWLDLPERLKPKNLLRHGDNRYDNRFGRLHWEGTFNTILTKPYPYWGRVIHPEQDRVLSVRECARAQSFPDSVRFSGSLSDKYKQVGNAVPPILAKAIGLKIVRAIEASPNR
jgi:DNA (cytosine-5)-methyltransferase 1